MIFLASMICYNLGDDHETWSLGLTPQLFWEFKEDILSPNVHNGEECEQVVRKILEQIRKQTSLSSMQHLYDSSSISLLHISKNCADSSIDNELLPTTRLGACPLMIGKFSNCKCVNIYIDILCEHIHHIL